MYDSAGPGGQPGQPFDRQHLRADNRAMAHYPVRILIVDDHAVVRQGLRMVLGLRPEIRVIGEAGTAAAAMQQALDGQPDLILLDLMLPDIPGPALVEEFRRYSPRAKILVLTGVQSVPMLQQAAGAGVEGFVPKEVTPDELVQAIHQVMAGRPFIHPKIGHLLERIQEEPPPLPELTPREQEVLRLMAHTATNREIAERLHVSEETVRTHVKHILRKLDQPTRTQAILEALRLGLLQLD